MGRKRRTRIFIGDVHGCSDELEDLLGELAYKPKRHKLWFVGDLVNRGPDSLGVLRRARELDASVVVGNHDLHLIGRVQGKRRSRPGDTLKKVMKAPDCDELIEWLRGQHVLRVWKDITLVHGGLHPQWNRPKDVAARLRDVLASHPNPLRHRELAFATTVRWCDHAGHQPNKRSMIRGLPKKPYAPWDSWYRGRRTVVFGHWAQRGRVVDHNVRGLDTGCVYGGRLTAWVEGHERTISVPARRQYVKP